MQMLSSSLKPARFIASLSLYGMVLASSNNEAAFSLRSVYGIPQSIVTFFNTWSSINVPFPKHLAIPKKENNESAKLNNVNSFVDHQATRLKKGQSANKVWQTLFSLIDNHHKYTSNLRKNVWSIDEATDSFGTLESDCFSRKLAAQEELENITRPYSFLRGRDLLMGALRPRCPDNMVQAEFQQLKAPIRQSSKIGWLGFYDEQHVAQHESSASRRRLKNFYNWSKLKEMSEIISSNRGRKLQAKIQNTLKKKFLDPSIAKVVKTIAELVSPVNSSTLPFPSNFSYQLASKVPIVFLEHQYDLYPGDILEKNYEVPNLSNEDPSQLNAALLDRLTRLKSLNKALEVFIGKQPFIPNEDESSLIQYVVEKVKNSNISFSHMKGPLGPFPSSAQLTLEELGSLNSAMDNTTKEHLKAQWLDVVGQEKPDLLHMVSPSLNNDANNIVFVFFSLLHPVNALEITILPSCSQTLQLITSVIALDEELAVVVKPELGFSDLPFWMYRENKKSSSGPITTFNLPVDFNLQSSDNHYIPNWNWELPDRIAVRVMEVLFRSQMKVH